MQLDHVVRTQSICSAVSSHWISENNDQFGMKAEGETITIFVTVVS